MRILSADSAPSDAGFRLHHPRVPARSSTLEGLCIDPGVRMLVPCRLDPYDAYPASAMTWVALGSSTTMGRAGAANPAFGRQRARCQVSARERRCGARVTAGGGAALAMD